MSTQLAQAHIEAQARLRKQTSQAVTAAWRSLPHYDRPDIAAWLRMVLPLILAAQRTSVSLVDAFLAQAVGRAPLGVDPAPLIGAGARLGTPPATVYERPFVTVWTALREGQQWLDAVEQGLARAQSAAATDVQLAARGAVRAVGEADEEIVGYRRVPDPGACDLCLLASTQRYHVSDLQPIHNRCGCSVDAITASADPGHVIDPELLRDLKQSGVAGDLSLQSGARRARERAAANREQSSELLAEARSEVDPDRADRLQDRAVRYARRARRQDALAADYADQIKVRKAGRSGLRLAVRDHGELGPVLVQAGQHFETEHEALAA